MTNMIRSILTLVCFLIICEHGVLLEATKADNIDWGEVRTLLSKINTAIRKQKEANEIEGIRYSSLSDDELTQYGDNERAVDLQRRQNPLTGDLFTEFGKRTSGGMKSPDIDSHGKRQNPLTGDLFTEFGKRNRPSSLKDDGKRQNPLTGDLFTEFGKRGQPLPGEIFTEFGKRQNPLTGDLFTEFGKRRENKPPYSEKSEDDMQRDEYIKANQHLHQDTGEMVTSKRQRNPLDYEVFDKRREPAFNGDSAKRQNPLTGDLFTEFGKRQNTVIDGKLSDKELADMYLQREESGKDDIHS
ncbi:uncharacterized protein LOC102808345 [Saccoglossus kowalevskii]|uniref:Uncharacterized protein LOC102808345 n=1 Tax=Saccoglossus kowalevskii TaxID=10224 RepID=A0ABM0ME78_SACKO|nr:PREDICTED: uncharacterized protein LOC102808345 [Saccoglossus kowalevskii]